MAATSQATLNQQPLFEDQEMPTQMGFFSFPPHLTYPQSASCHQSLKGFIIPPSLAADAPSTTNLTETLLLSSATNKQREDTIASDFGGPHLLSLQRSGANLWAWGEVNECLNSKRSGSGGDHLGVSTIKMKKIKARRKVREPRRMLAYAHSVHSPHADSQASLGEKNSSLLQSLCPLSSELLYDRGNTATGR
ncbi:hypothetical protein D5086_010310 [Populus alba]|uniref:Uncharacterized protein n=1 Tax=Populus alba TaxID=43335 RepID=A0ACC4CAA5_POPAL